MYTTTQTQSRMSLIILEKKDLTFPCLDHRRSSRSHKKEILHWRKVVVKHMFVQVAYLPVVWLWWWRHHVLDLTLCTELSRNKGTMSRGRRKVASRDWIVSFAEVEIVTFVIQADVLESDRYYTWVDQKVLKLLAYLFEFTTELYKNYTECKVNIS